MFELVNQKAKRKPPEKEEVELVDNTSDNMTFSNTYLKRLIDIIGASLLLLILGITLFPLLAVAILIESLLNGHQLGQSGTGIFFIQDRTGKGMKTFSCVKFRTMLPINTKQPRSEEERITKIGGVMRNLHLDELPQLWNVLVGDMSLVGPRPHMLSDTERFESRLPYYNRRHLVKPGITGLAQIRGYYGWVNDDNHLRMRVMHDLDYVNSRSLVGDFMIMLKTITIPLKPTRV